MYKIFVLGAVTLIVASCGGSQTSKVLSYQPQIWKSDANSVSVTRPAMATSYDTERVAKAYCEELGKTTKLTLLASPLRVPMRDEYACE